MNFYLKAESEEALWEALEAKGLAVKDYNPDDPLNQRPDDAEEWEPTGAFTHRFVGIAPGHRPQTRGCRRGWPPAAVGRIVVAILARTRIGSVGHETRPAGRASARPVVSTRPEPITRDAS